MIEDLLTDLSASGWTISMAFQYAPDEWRCTIIKTEELANGYDQPDYHVAYCAFAPTFAEALEDAMSKRSEAEFIEGAKITYSSEEPRSSFLSTLTSSLRVPSPPINRRRI